MQPDPKHEKTIQNIKKIESLFHLATYYFACFMVFRYWMDMIFWVAFPTCVFFFLSHLLFRRVEDSFINWLVKPFLKTDKSSSGNENQTD